MARKRKKSNKSRGRGIYILPNLFTTASLFSGFFSIISSIEGDFVTAAAAIIVSGVLDGLDGAVARMTKTTSKFGVEYDSLADMVAFGAAPGVMAYLWALQPYGRMGWVAAFLYVACGALRLARFNVYVPVKSQKYFQGLPIPAAAGMLAVTVFLFNYLGRPGPIQNGAVLLLVFALAFLMVSNFRYFSLKNVDLLKSKPFNTLVSAVVLLALIAIRPQVFLFVFGLAYVVSGPFTTVVLLRRSRRMGWDGSSEAGEESPATDGE